MSVRIAIYQLLTQAPEVARLVADRVYPLALPQNPTFPLILYERTGTARTRSMRGSTGQATATLDLSLMHQPEPNHDQDLELARLAEEVRLLLDGYTQRRPEEYVQFGGTRITRIFVQDERDVLFAPIHGEEIAAQGVLMPLEVAFEERTSPSRVSP